MPPLNGKSAKTASAKRCDPLSFGQLESLSDGAIVWIRYQKSGESTARIDQAARLEKVRDGVWEFRDTKTDSSICDMMRECGSSDSDLAIQYCRGEFQVFSATSELYLAAGSTRRDANRPRS